ncbi:hypothetical protein [Lacticaseibacillus hulanensis]|uniref:hypothetical protein n=1 Tax=Lacticaseibacillus hulanensis TaxID=2493111 RepID=UPI000FD839DC|nr:hypothetical protein [Lacticaseibacillus hulanensis]
MFKKILYGALIVLTALLWGVTAFAKPNSNNTVRVAGITHHQQPKLNKPSNDPDPLAKYRASEATKQFCTWVLGASAAFMVLCPIAAWEITLPRAKNSAKLNNHNFKTQV